MKVGIVDADLLDHGTRHPNLALMKLSGWYNNVRMGADGHVIYKFGTDRVARLVTEADIAECKYLRELVGPHGKFKKLVISKVFDFSKLPPILEEAFVKGLMTEGCTSADGSDVKMYKLLTPRIIYGGTGFINNLERKANVLPSEIEHHFPDYHLYDEYVDHEINVLGKEEKHYKDYRYYSIGFLTRGCFRRCKFCVNKHEKLIRPNSHVKEFLDPDRPFVYLWDDNFLGFINHADTSVPGVANGSVSWLSLLEELRSADRPFQFRQGLDIRLMTSDIARTLSACKYHGDYIFAFDHYSQKQLIVDGLVRWKRENPTNVAKLYLFCGYEHVGREVEDILLLFRRIRILMHFGVLPYVMRHVQYKASPFAGMYTHIARWCNQPQFFKKKSFREFVMANEDYHNVGQHRNEHCSAYVAMTQFIDSELYAVLDNGQRCTTNDIANEFFDLKWEDLRYRWESNDFGEQGLIPPED